MKKFAFATIAASALAAVIGLAATAAAIPSGNGHDNGSNSSPAYPTTGQTPYGTYQNPHKSR